MKELFCGPSWRINCSAAGARMAAKVLMASSRAAGAPRERKFPAPPPKGGHSQFRSNSVGGGPELVFFFEELDDGGRGDAEVDGDGGGVAVEGLEEVEDEAQGGGIEGMAVGGFDAGLAADGEEPVGRFEP